MSQDAPDTLAASTITDHPFKAPKERHSSRCAHVYINPTFPATTRKCNLSEAAHAFTTSDKTSATPEECTFDCDRHGGPHYCMCPDPERTEEQTPDARAQIMQTEGHKDDSEKVTVRSVMPTFALTEMAKVMQKGAVKYERHNFRKGFKASRLIDAAGRHLDDWWEGEENDPEFDLSHLAHAMCCIGMLLDCQILGTMVDDRYGRGENASS